MLLGELIEKIRNEKNITVKALIGNQISKSTYSRFVNNKTMISADSLLYLLNQLHITLGLFLLLYTDFFELKYDYVILKHCLESKSISGLTEMLDKWSQKNIQFNDSQKLFIETLEFSLANLKGETVLDESINQLNTTYSALTYWTDYDLKSLRATMDFIDIRELIKYVNEIIDETENVDETPVHEEVFYVVGQVFCRCLMEGRYIEAEVFYDVLINLHISQYDLGKQIYRKYYQGLAGVALIGRQEDANFVDSAIDYWQLLGMDCHAMECTEIYESVIQHKQLAELMNLKGVN